MKRLISWVWVVLGSVLIALPAAAQEGQGDVVYVPTPQVVVDDMLKMAHVGPKDFVIDLGSGDGRIVITAAQKFGARGFGVDLDTYLLKKARENARKAGVADRVRFMEQNLFETDLSQATVITSYLLPELNEKLRPKLLKLKPGTRVVTHDYDMGDWYPDEQKTIIVPEKEVGDPGKSYIFFYVVPAAIAGRWESLLYIGGHGLLYEFDFDQNYQTVEGEVYVDGNKARLPVFKVRGDEVSFDVRAPQGKQLVPHRFRGRVQGDGITGTVTVGTGANRRNLPWKATLKIRGELRASAIEPTGRVFP